MKTTMASIDPTSFLDFAPFDGEEHFFRWVGTYHGSDVRNQCKAELEEAVRNKVRVSPLVVVDKLTRATRQIDRSRVGIRARFAY